MTTVGSEGDRRHYGVHYRLDQREGCLAWHTSEGLDGVLVNAERRDVLRATAEGLCAYLDERGVGLVEDPFASYDLDALDRWLRHPRKRTVDCAAFLNSWSLFTDVAVSSGREGFDPKHRASTKVYSKLFFGCNLPSITPPGRHYEPIWRRREIDLMRTILGGGLGMFRDALATGEERDGRRNV